MNTTELRKRILSLLDKVESNTLLQQYYEYLKSKRAYLTKLWEQYYDVYSFKKAPEESAHEEQDFISQTHHRIENFLN
jgi:hypothetical protein